MKYNIVFVKRRMVIKIINQHVRVEELSEETKETEQIISEYFTGILAKKINDLEMELNKKQEVKDIKKIQFELEKAKEKKMIIDTVIECECLTKKEISLLKHLYAYNIGQNRASKLSGYGRYKGKTVRKRLVETIKSMLE